jgi:scyllo-inositol 2-dehydrogenase (NADP+)
MPSQLNVALIGFGMAGQVFHAPLLSTNPHLRLTHILERRSNLAQAKYPQAKVVRDLESILADHAIDLVVVATPNTSHFEIASRSLQAGKHVVVDKPFTNTSSDADKLMEQAQKAKRILSVFQNRRWDGDFLTVQQILNKKLLGRIVEFESRFDRFRPELKQGAWREQDLPGSGVLFDLGAHLIDQAVVLFGRPAGIYADVRKQRDGAAAVDNFEVRLEYSNLKVTLKAGSLVCEPSPRFVVYGTAGSYIKFGLDPQEEILKAGGLPNTTGWGAEAEQAWGTLATCNDTITRKKYPTLNGCYPEYYTNVYQAITGQAELAVKPEQARETIHLIELAEQSAQERRMIPNLT